MTLSWKIHWKRRSRFRFDAERKHSERAADAGVLGLTAVPPEARCRLNLRAGQASEHGAPSGQEAGASGAQSRWSGCVGGVVGLRHLSRLSVVSGTD